MSSWTEEERTTFIHNARALAPGIALIVGVIAIFIGAALAN